MNRKTQLSCLIVAGLSFLFCFAIIQSIQFGYEKIPFSISIYGKNLKGVNTYFNNKLIKNLPLQITDSSNTKYTFEVPIYAYIRNLRIIVDYNKLLEIHKIELQGNENKITIKSSDIPNYLRYSNYLYNPKSKQFNQIDSSKIFDNPKLIITSIDISNFTNELYIKRTSLPKSILYSILISTLITIVYYFLFLKDSSRIVLKIVTSIAIIVIITSSTYSMLNQRNASKEDLSEKSIFDVIKPHTPNNLIYNGDFKYGLMFWGAYADSTTLEIIDTPYGKGVKITRGNGDGGDWSLRYYGRPITYNANHTYQIKLKFKINKGNGIPFHLGWWIPSSEKEYLQAIRLNKEIKKINNNWYSAEAKYTFKFTHKNLVCLMHSVNNLSEIIVTDIEIVDLNVTNKQL